MGPHGTALQWALVMPRGAVLAEVQYAAYSCAPPGVNHPGRQRCEYGAAAVAAGVTYVSHRVADASAVRCAPNDPLRRHCDVTLGAEERRRLLGTVLCALDAGYDDAAERCQADARGAGAAVLEGSAVVDGIDA